MITELKNPVTENYKELKNIILTEQMGWFYQSKTTFNSKDKDIDFFSHELLRSPQHENNGIQVPAISIPNSDHFERCYFILKEILDFNNISNYIVETRGGTKDTWGQLADLVAHHETGFQQRMDPLAIQISQREDGTFYDGPGRG